MHVLFVTGEYPPLTGGVGAYTAALARALAAQGVAVSVLTSAQAAPQAAQDGVAVHATVKRWGPAIWRETLALARSAAADWLHVQYQTAAYGMNPSINFAPERWRQTRPVAWTYHDLRVPYLFPKAGAALRRWVTERPAHTANAVIVTNEGDRLRLAGRAADLRAIPIGSNVEGRTLSAEERIALRASYGYTNNHLVVGYFGFLNRSKGGLTLVDALHALVQRGIDAHLLMVGERLGASDPTNAGYLAEVEARIAACGLGARVRWTGRLPDTEVSAALNALDVLLLPYTDGASLRRGTLMAGLANGCAIVTTTPQEPLPELLDGRDLLYAAPDDAEGCAALVARIAADCAVGERLRANSRARSAIFRWESIAAQHIAIYEGRAQ